MKMEKFGLLALSGGGGGGGLPPVSSADNGKVLAVEDGNWAAADGALVCTFTKPSSTISCDKSRTEILAAYDAGKQVYGKCNLTSLFGSGFGGTGIFRLVNVDENNNRHATFACEYYFPGDPAVADRYASLYIKGFTVISDYAWSAAYSPLPSAPANDDEGKAYSVSSGVAGWNSKAVPVPDDVSMSADEIRHLVAAPNGTLAWEGNAPLATATGIMDSSGTYSLNDYILLALQGFLTSAVSNPGVFTAATQAADFSASASFTDFLTEEFSGRNSRLLLVATGAALVLYPISVAINTNVGTVNAISYHAAGQWEVTAGVYVFCDATLQLYPTGVDIIGFAMPTTMTQAPTLSGTYTSGTNTLNITGGA